MRQGGWDIRPVSSDVAVKSMFCNLYRFAQLNIEFHHQYPQLARLCRGYEAEGKSDLSITVDDGDIAYERIRSEAEARRSGEPLTAHSDGYLETLSAYRKLCEALVRRDIILFHGSAVAVDGAGYLFTAPSGTGKSTHTRLWRELLGDRAVMINDDKPLIRVGSGETVIYGTPWNGKHHLGTNLGVPLKAICILRRDTANHIERISPSEAFPMLVQQCNRPCAPESVRHTLYLLQCMTRQVSFYRLGCNMDLEAAKIAYEGMRGSERADHL